VFEDALVSPFLGLGSELVAPSQGFRAVFGAHVVMRGEICLDIASGGTTGWCWCCLLMDGSGCGFGGSGFGSGWGSGFGSGFRDGSGSGFGDGGGSGFGDGGCSGFGDGGCSDFGDGGCSDFGDRGGVFGAHFWSGVAFLDAVGVMTRTGRAGECGREGGRKDGEGEKETNGRHSKRKWVERKVGRDGGTSSSSVGL